MKLTIYTVTTEYDGETTTEVFTNHELARKVHHEHHKVDFGEVFPDTVFPAYDAEDVGPQMQEFFDKRDEIGSTWTYVKLEEHEICLGKLSIILDGGLVQNVVSDGPLVDMAGVYVVDYDTEHIEDDQITVVSGSNGETTNAYVTEHGVEQSTISFEL